MPTKGKKSSAKKTAGSAKKASPKDSAKSSAAKSAARQPATTKAEKRPLNSDEEQYLRSVLIRGEAAPLDEEGTLPLEATHEITGEGEEGELPVIERRRFKAF